MGTVNCGTTKEAMKHISAFCLLHCLVTAPFELPSRIPLRITPLLSQMSAALLFRLFLAWTYDNTCWITTIARVRETVCTVNALIRKERYLKWRSKSTLKRQVMNYGAELCCLVKKVLRQRRCINTYALTRWGISILKHVQDGSQAISDVMLRWWPPLSLCPLSLLHSSWTPLNFIVAWWAFQIS